MSQPQTPGEILDANPDILGVLFIRHNDAEPGIDPDTELPVTVEGNYKLPTSVLVRTLLATALEQLEQVDADARHIFGLLLNDEEERDGEQP